MSNQNNLSEVQLWILALSAVLSQLNRQRYDTLYIKEITQKEIDIIKRGLKRDHGVSNKSELLEVLSKFLTDGNKYGEYFFKERYFLTALSEDAQNDYLRGLNKDSQWYADYYLVKNYDRIVPEAGLLAYDYGRYVFTCRSAAIVNLISEEEAWELMLKVAKIAQKAYSSWREYGLAFILGRQTWSGNLSSDSTEDQFVIIKPLIIDKNSPWNILDWNLKLE
jgi:hypothetical protein